MKRYLLVIVACLISAVGFSQKPVVKKTVTCNEVKFWVQQVQNNFNKINFDSTKPQLFSSRQFIGFDTTEFINNVTENTFEVTGISFRFKKSNEAKLMFENIKKLASTCLVNQQLRKEQENADNNGAYYYAEKKYSNGNLLAIEIRWMVNQEFSVEEDVAPACMLWFKIYFNRK